MLEDRAVSDSLGFILVFAIIISTVGAVYIGGFQSLDDARQYERMNNAERAFEVFADNVEDITQRGAPSRATEIKLAEASMQSGPSREIRINVSPSGQPGGRNNSWGYEPLVYESQTDRSNEMAYELGANFRSSTGGTTMSERPAWVIGEDRVIIPVVRTDHDGEGSITGSETILVRTQAAGSRDVWTANKTGSTDVTINISTPRADAWRAYMKSQSPEVTCPPSENGDGQAYCTIEDVETVYVTVVRIRYEFL